MHMNLILGRVKTGLWPEYERTFLQANIPIQELPGLVCRWLLRDMDDTDAGFALSLWETEADLNRYVSSDAIRQIREQRFKALFAEDFTRYICEVRVESPGALDHLLRSGNADAPASNAGAP